MAKKNKSFKVSREKRRNHLKQKVQKKKISKKLKGKVKKYFGRLPQQKTRAPLQEHKDDFVAEDILDMLEKEDVKFLEEAAKHCSYEMLRKIRFPERRPLKKFKSALDEQDDDRLERLYEEEINMKDTKSTKLLLPIKTKDGLIMQTTEIDEEEEERKKLEREILEKQKAKEKLKKKKGEEEEEEKEEDIMDMDEDMDPSTNIKGISSLSNQELRAYREELLQKRKFQIGVLSAGLLESPEMKIGNFKFLLEIMNKDNSAVKFTVCKLATISLFEVFKDLLPSYEIKHPEAPPGFKLKKSTQTLQSYEKSLLKAYKLYLQNLERMGRTLRRKRGDSRLHDPRAESLGLLAVRCMTELLIKHPYFNFSPNIGRALVHFLDNKNSTVRAVVSKGLRAVLREDKRGELSLHIVRRINYLVRKKNHAVHPEILSIMFALRLKDVNLDAEKEFEMKQKKLQSHKQRILSLSKRERKKNKLLEGVEQEMLETKAEENKQTKHKYMTEITKTMFTIIFRILKSAPSSKLLSVSLEGLAKFAHCINFDFFQDLINVLNHLLVEENLGHVEQLHCLETVFTILSGQGDVLNIDPLRFYAHLYRSLMEVHGGLTNADAAIVLRILEKAVIARRRKVSLQRLFAFTKRLCTLAPHMMHGAALGYLAVIHNILSQTKCCDVLLDTDTCHGQGIYQPELPEPEYCCASASVLWELVLLTQHYHPEVRQMAHHIIKGENKAFHPEIAKLSPTQLAEAYDSSQMAFRPAVPAPRKTVPRSRHGRLVLIDDALDEYMHKVEDSVRFETLQCWNVPGLDTSA